MNPRSLFPALVACSLSACGGSVALDDPQDGGAPMGSSQDGRVTTTSDSGSSTTTPAVPTGSADAAAIDVQACNAASSSGLGLTVSGVVYRFKPNGASYSFRPANEEPNWIDTQDCDDNIYLEFTLVESGLPTTDTIQVWAGTIDCSESTARMGSTGGPYCWQVASPGQFAPSQTATGKIYVRDILQYLDATSSPHFSPPTSVPGASACDVTSSLGDCSVPINLYFLFVANDGFTADSCTAYPTAAINAPGDGGTCPGR